MKTTSLDTLIDKHVGKLGTQKREKLENELRLDILGETMCANLIPDVSQQRELLLAFLKWNIRGEVLEHEIKGVDDFLKQN